MGIDLDKIFREYDENIAPEKPNKAPAPNNAFGEDRSKQAAVKTMVSGSGSGSGSGSNHSGSGLSDSDEKRMAMAAKIAQEHDREINGAKLSAGEYQRFLHASFTNTLEVKNAQKVVMIANRDNVRRGLGLEVWNMALAKNAGSGRVSTVAIPTQLLRYVQQEIGGLSMKATQNDIMTGFLYWYFGKPDDVPLGKPDAIAKIAEITAALDANSSPARFNKMSYNASNTVLDRLDELIGKIEQILSLVAGLTQDSLTSKIKSDKIYLALCYNILNMLAFTPPTMPGEKAQDVDILAGGLVWDLMTGVDSAYDYYKAKNGREIYRSKYRSKPTAYTAPSYAQPAAQQAVSYAGQDAGYDDSYDDEPDYNDEYEGYEDVNIYEEAYYADAAVFDDSYDDRSDLSRINITNERFEDNG